MNEYLIVQTILYSIDRPNEYTLNNNWSNIIRVVNANNKEEALGMFIIKTKKIKALERLTPDIYMIDDIIRL